MRSIVLLACAFSCSLLPAQGLHPTSNLELRGLRLTHLQVRAEVQDQVATTELVQSIRNDGDRVAEALWILPLPEGATADGFTMTVGGVELVGEVLDGQSARRIYQDIVRRKRDPGILEYAGRGALRARVFPIPAKGTVEVKVRYRQVLPQTGGLHLWSYPLRSAAVGRLFAESTSVDLRIRSRLPIRNVFSALPAVEIRYEGEHEARVSFEATQMPPRDLEVYFGLDEKEFGLNLLTWRKGERPGYFAMILAPKRDWPEETEFRRHIKFVVDTSGSMIGKKLEQAKGALRFFVNSMHPQDRFDIVSFATEAESLFGGYAEVNEGTMARGRQYIDSLQARGGTNLADALHQALRGRDAQRAPGSLPLTVLLTDGLPTVGTITEDEILALVRRQNRLQQRVFVFGVGHDLNTRLLDRIAADTGGARDYVREDESIEVKTGALFTRLSHPVLTDLQIECDPMDGFAIHPTDLPDLFKGDRLVVLGRYRSPGVHDIRLRGFVAGKPREYVYRGNFTADAVRHDFVPPLWAERRVGMLLDAIRLHGQDRELLDEIRRLGREFGIVTPYTSHLILEESERIRLVQGAGASGGAAPGAGAPGAAGGAAAAAAAPPRAGRGPTAAGPSGPSGPGGTRPGTAAASEQAARARVRETLADLQRAGALPKDASETELQDFAKRLGDEVMRAERRLAGLTVAASGARAVDTSLYLARFGGGVTSGSDEFFMGVVGRRAAPDRSLAELITRRVAGRTFRLRNGVWVDTAYDEEEMKDELVTVVAFSDEYFELLQQRPELARFFAFSNHILVVLDTKSYRVTARL